jgi:hypothetical protein
MCKNMKTNIVYKVFLDKYQFFSVKGGKLPVNRENPSVQPKRDISPEGELNLYPEVKLTSGTAISPPSGGLGG